MIEKLKQCDSNHCQVRKDLVGTINQLVDAVNKLEALLDLTNTAIQTLKKPEPADPYSEQKNGLESSVGFGMMTNPTKHLVF